jgi:hypothetical protein
MAVTAPSGGPARPAGPHAKVVLRITVTRNQNALQESRVVKVNADLLAFEPLPIQVYYIGITAVTRTVDLRQSRLNWACQCTAWKSQKAMLHSKFKRPTVSTHFQRPGPSDSEGIIELANVISESGSRACPPADGFSNNKRSNGRLTHPLKPAILISRARSEASAKGAMPRPGYPSLHFRVDVDNLSSSSKF